MHRADEASGAVTREVTRGSAKPLTLLRARFGREVRVRFAQFAEPTAILRREVHARSRAGAPHTPKRFAGACRAPRERMRQGLAAKRCPAHEWSAAFSSHNHNAIKWVLDSPKTNMGSAERVFSPAMALKSYLGVVDVRTLSMVER